MHAIDTTGSQNEVFQKFGVIQRIVSLGSRLHSFVLSNPHPELGSYIQILRILYFGGAALLIVPVYICYDQEGKLYRIRKCNLLQQVCCIFVQLVFSFSMVRRIADRVQALLEHKTNMVNYFDMVNESVLNLFIYWHLYVHWFQRSRIENYVNRIQTTLLLRFDKTSMWKVKIFPVICWPLCLYLSFSWTRAIHQVDLTSMKSILATGGRNANQIFWFDVSNTGFAPMFADLDVEEVMMFYKEYKYLMSIANKYCSGYLQYYVSMTVSFNSVHLFETLNTSDTFWKSNMLVYDFETWLIMWIPTTVVIQGKGMKKWLWKDKNYMSINRQNLSLTLHDMIPTTPGKGMEASRNLVVTSAFTGKVLTTMWSYSMMKNYSGTWNYCIEEGIKI
ncbi:unnamed protein product [Allacma fusca]|uniref:Uncharacterized protein n=1 Tax=Allacma fusca TaxID=39272 RepID=A0A8J2JQK9_9HEXA|nr:unnamed protein product [Allacma fusca]